MRTIFLLSVLLSIQLVHAQRTVKAYTDLESYMKKQYLALENVIVIAPNKQEIKMNRGNDYRVSSTDKDVLYDLRAHIWAIEYNDTLMLNMRMIKSFGYVIALCRTSNYILFRAGIGNVKDAQSDPTMELLFGGIGGIMNAVEEERRRFDYLLDVHLRKVVVLTDEGGGLKDVLASNKELQQKYIDEGMPRDNASYIRYLKALDGTK